MVVGLHVYHAAVAAPDREQDEVMQSITAMARAMQLIRQDYVDEKKIDYDALTHAALKGMIGSARSAFAVAKDQKDFKEWKRTPATGSAASG